MSNVLKIVVILVTFLLTWRLSYSVTYKLTNVICESRNQSWVTINECRLKAVNRNRTVFNFNATIHHPTNDVVIDYRFLKRENGYKPWLYKKNIDGCRFLRKPYDMLTKMIYMVFKPFSNINHTCPFYGDILIRGMYLRTEIKAMPYPSGKYMLQINWSFYKKIQVVTNISYDFIENLL
uniref:MD-2-related lipid-recognition domain-containing protein n=1 Tax=Drosophila melanogaster TaxID=7227 RepID=Q4ABJ4_DROME|nr:uncharacterized protein Dmel_CG33795 [Drosophila melanogaster]AAZ66061.2 uncharacterized protein Dmel_CG33795 [Drosophila melanogaster]|eukprot:NP_001027129.2 uncharacterized protein Dmel_CG33795 [Drosophila melanogaster]